MSDMRKVGATVAVLYGFDFVALVVTGIILTIVLGGQADAPGWFSIWAIISFAPFAVAAMIGIPVGIIYAIVWLSRVWRDAA